MVLPQSCDTKRLKINFPSSKFTFKTLQMHNIVSEDANRENHRVKSFEAASSHCCGNIFHLPLFKWCWKGKTMTRVWGGCLCFQKKAWGVLLASPKCDWIRLMVQIEVMWFAAKKRPYSSSLYYSKGDSLLSFKTGPQCNSNFALKLNWYHHWNSEAMA